MPKVTQNLVVTESGLELEFSCLESNAWSPRSPLTAQEKKGLRTLLRRAHSCEKERQRDPGVPTMDKTEADQPPPGSSLGVNLKGD